MASVKDILLLGKPNSGKSVIFNKLTGGRQKVGNYPGVTIEEHIGFFRDKNGVSCQLHDLPGLYGLQHNSPEEELSAKALQRASSQKSTILLFVLEATQLQVGLNLLVETKQYANLPTLILLNKIDVAQRRGLLIDEQKLSALTAHPVLPLDARSPEAAQKILQELARIPENAPSAAEPAKPEWQADTVFKEVCVNAGKEDLLSALCDKFFLHPFWGLGCFALLVFVLFQAVFSWSSYPMDGITAVFDFLIALSSNFLPESYLRDLLTEGMLAGVAGVLIFLPQLIILFAGLAILEDSGYTARAAYLLDAVMQRVGLNGKAFIPLLTSYACAIPAITATRMIENPKARLLTIIITPLTTCSARLPVYALLISAFVPRIRVWGFNLQGLTLFILYLLGIVSLLLCAKLFNLTFLRGASSPMLLELPDYSMPHLPTLISAVSLRCGMFIRRAGLVILPITILIWVLSSFPAAPENTEFSAIYYSYNSIIARFLQPLFAPLGFNWQMVAALIPGIAAREVAVSALATVYSVDSEGVFSLQQLLTQSWSIASAFSFLVWYVYAPQCIATVAVIHRETNSLRWTGFAVFYLTLLAYLASFLTYNIAGVFL